MIVESILRIFFFIYTVFIFAVYSYMLIKIHRAENTSAIHIPGFFDKVILFNVLFIIITALFILLFP